LAISNDANTLVLRPVENMIKRVDIIRQNPLCAMKMADEEFMAEEKEKSRKTRMTKKQSIFASLQACLACKGSTGKSEEPMETVVLEKTIIKLGSLLALGFGEAGANIIGHNMESSDSAGVNAMIAGTRVECIIGVARIRDFSTTTEVLQSKVMTFVNQIAEIVHGVVNEFHGAANKNNGDTFLIIWRTSGLSQDMVARMADMSMISFAKILGSVHRSPILANYRNHPGLQQRLGSNCRVHVSMGLHSGWAIEGAVGSEYKIDASYLSPNVSIATSVENATKVYGVPILVSQATRDLCTQDVTSKCRLIDNVLIRGSPQPMQLFCLDLDYLGLTVDDGASAHRPVLWNSRWRFKARQFLEVEKSRKIDPDVKTSAYFQDKKDISQMRRLYYNVEFMQKFTMGYQNYSEGEWPVAKKFLQDTRNMLRGAEDGPSAALLHFMEAENFKAPDGWIGVRDLAPYLV
jgi:class 3 adenylate cyclase